MQTYRRGAGRVRARRGRAALGRRRQGVPRLPRRDLGLLGRPLPPGGGRGGARAGRAPDARLQPLLHRADGAARRAALASRASAAASSSANSGTEANECAIKLARKHAHGRGIDGAGDRQLRGRLPRPHLRRALGDARRWPRNEALGADAARLPLGAARRRRRRCATAVGERTAAVLIEPIQGEAGVYPITDEALLAAREACDASRRAADLRRDPDRDGADRLALGLRADAGAARRDDHRQGARRRPADRRLRDRRRRPARCSSPATTARPSPAARSSPPRRWPCSRSSTTRRCCARVRELGARAARRAARRSTASREVRGRGLMVGVGLEDGHRRRRGRRRPARARADRQRARARARCGCCRR